MQARHAGSDSDTSAHVVRLSTEENRRPTCPRRPPRWSSSASSTGRTCTSRGRRSSSPWTFWADQRTRGRGAPAGHPDRAAERATGEVGSGFRQRFAVRAVAGLVRQVAAEAGTQRLGVRVRPTADVEPRCGRVPVAPSRPGRGTRAGGGCRAGLASRRRRRCPGQRQAATMRLVDPGPAPATLRPRVPIVAVTGTNGKTTTSRMIAHIGRCAGLHVGWSSTDGIYVDGVLVEAGDYSGPSGAGRVLRTRTSSSRSPRPPAGGSCCAASGCMSNDVAVVTNVSRRPSRGCRASTRSTSSPRSRRWYPDHQTDRMGRTQRGRPAGDRDAVADRGPSVGLLPRPGLAVAARGGGRRRPGDDVIDGWIASSSPTPIPIRWCGSSTCR